MKSYLRVHGIVYDCTLVYARFERLDPLAELVYEGLRHERDIERLSRSFGLPAPLVDNILVDLIRRGFAVLDIDRNQLLRVDNPSAQPEYRESRSERVWYDLATGGLVVERRTRGFSRRPREAFEEVVLAIPQSGVPDFIEIPDAQVLAQLVRHEPTLEWEEGRQWRLDYISVRRRIATRPLWLEIRHLKLFTENVGLIQEEDIPQWMTRSWTSALARQRSTPAPSVFAAQTQGPTDPDLLATVSAPRTLERWAHRFDEVLARSPRPVSSAELAELADSEALLLRLVESRCGVERGSGSAFAGLAAVVRSALVVLDEWREEAIDAIATALSELRKKKEFVDLGVLIPGGRERLVPALLARGVPEQTLQTRLVVDELREGARCSCVVLDEREVRLAGARTLHRMGGWLRFVAPADDTLELARAMRATTTTFCRREEFAIWIRQRSTERARRRGVESDALDKPSALHSRLQDFIRAKADVGDESVASLRSVDSENAAELDAAVSDIRAAVERCLAAQGGAVCRHLDATERPEVITAALGRARPNNAPGTLLLAVRTVGGLCRDPGLIAAVRRALELEWRLTFAAPADVAARLVELFSAGLSQDLLARLDVRPPLDLDLSVLAVRDWVCVSTVDWLDAEVHALCWTVVIERVGLLQQLLK